MRLRRAVDERWPHRSKRHDGWLGDQAHALRVSDHNPDRRGRVHAIDVTASGVEPRQIVRACIAHPSTEYVIWDGSIFSRWRHFIPAQYFGPNPHTSHLHISVSHDVVGRRSEDAWRIRA